MQHRLIEKKKMIGAALSSNITLSLGVFALFAFEEQLPLPVLYFQANHQSSLQNLILSLVTGANCCHKGFILASWHLYYGLFLELLALLCPEVV